MGHMNKMLGSCVYGWILTATWSERHSFEGNDEIRIVNRRKIDGNTNATP
jgi:hypothetical protein